MKANLRERGRKGHDLLVSTQFASLDENKPKAAECYCGFVSSRDYFAIQPNLSTTDIAATAAEMSP